MQNWSTRSLESCAVHSPYRPIHGCAKDVVAVQGNGTHSSALIWRAGEGTWGVLPPHVPSPALQMSAEECVPLPPCGHPKGQWPSYLRRSVTTHKGITPVVESVAWIRGKQYMMISKIWKSIFVWRFFGMVGITWSTSTYSNLFQHVEELYDCDVPDVYKHKQVFFSPPLSAQHSWQTFQAFYKYPCCSQLGVIFI